MFRKEKKAQAAMEFLMTYGWAILAAIIAIGVLAYFGVFSPGKFTPTAAVLNAPLYANAWNVEGATGTVSVEVKNNGGDTITLSAFTITGAEQGGTSVTCAAGAPTNVLDPGELATVTSICNTGSLTVGQTFKGDISVSYTKSGGSLALSSTGTIADKIV